jgi:hypothetical protein
MNTTNVNLDSVVVDTSMGIMESSVRFLDTARQIRPTDITPETLTAINNIIDMEDFNTNINVDDLELANNVEYCMSATHDDLVRRINNELFKFDVGKSLFDQYEKEMNEEMLDNTFSTAINKIHEYEYMAETIKREFANYEPFVKLTKELKIKFIDEVIKEKQKAAITINSINKRTIPRIRII